MVDYLWYFHSDEEGQNIGGLIVKPPNLKVKRIPVTPKLLLDFANLFLVDSTWELNCSDCGTRNIFNLLY